MRALLIMPVLALAASLGAQESSSIGKSGSPDAQELASRRAEQLDRLLELSPEQREAVEAALLKTAPRMQELRRQLEELENKLNADIMAALDESQKERFQQALESRRRGGGGPGARGGAGQGMQGMGMGMGGRGQGGQRGRGRMGGGLRGGQGY